MTYIFMNSPSFFKLNTNSRLSTALMPNQNSQEDQIANLISKLKAEQKKAMLTYGLFLHSTDAKTR